jgi:hypothetical protein
MNRASCPVNQETVLEFPSALRAVGVNNSLLNSAVPFGFSADVQRFRRDVAIDLKILIRKSSHIDVVEINFFNSVGKVLDS